MDNKTFPITLPPELVQQWHDEAMKGFRTNCIYEQDIATQAAQWGADQELEACIAWFDKHIPGYELVADRLRAARRPKPPSLKEQALIATDCVAKGYYGQPDNIDIIRRALEALPDD